MKDVGPDELADTIRMAARGESVLHPRVAARVVQEVRGARRDTPNLFTDLSDRELEVLRLIADGLSNAEIASKLVISEKTVKGHVSNILGKLHMMDRTQAAVYAWQQGLVARARSVRDIFPRLFWLPLILPINLQRVLISWYVTHHRITIDTCENRCCCA